ncbi:MAG: NADH-quinone oxidoreductase subunit J [Chloroherpetonaceae bacterium]|nr:NADH-quinone oxidoreductase subunit J [bacterium]
MNWLLITFIILGAIAIASGLITVLNRHPIYSALALIVHFFSLAGLYLSLQSQFIAILQIIVYAGAIMVLVVFVLLLLNLSESEKQQLQHQSRRGVGVVLLAIFIIVLSNILMVNFTPPAELVSRSSLFTAQSIGQVLFSNYLFPIEITGLLLFAAIIGAMVMAKKKLID